MQHKGIEVGFVASDDGAELLVYSYLGEEAWIGQGLEQGSAQLAGEIDIAQAAVAETEPRW